MVACSVARDRGVGIRVDGVRVLAEALSIVIYTGRHFMSLIKSPGTALCSRASQPDSERGPDPASLWIVGILAGYLEGRPSLLSPHHPGFHHGGFRLKL